MSSAHGEPHHGENAHRSRPIRMPVIAEIADAAPPERVFQALTERGPGAAVGERTPCSRSRFGRWMRDPDGKMAIQIEGTQGKECGQRSTNQRTERFTEIDPPRVLTYTWLGNWHEPPYQPADRALGAHCQLATARRVKVKHSGLKPTAGCVRKDYSARLAGRAGKLRKHCE